MEIVNKKNREMNKRNQNDWRCNCVNWFCKSLVNYGESILIKIKRVENPTLSLRGDVVVVPNCY